MKAICKTFIILIILISISACNSLSSLPEVETESTEATPRAQANDQTEDEGGYDDETDVIDPACQMEEVLIYVDYDHRWTWSPDGTENTGAYVGTATGTATFLLVNDGDGHLASDTDTIFYSQEGDIHGDSDICTISNGRGSAEMDLYGTCKDGAIELEWIEIDSGKSEATMVCDGKESAFITYHPVQFIPNFPLGNDGLGYKQSNHTAQPNFYNISMEWTFRYVPPGQQ